MIRRSSRTKGLPVLLLFASSILLSGCQSHELVRSETIALSAGDAIAANSVMQMVHPWPPSVKQTSLVTPADLEQYKPQPQNAEQSGTNGGNGEPYPNDTTTQ
ncbi:hypothetical protein [Sinorhizobium meliloti]|uniref:hypothetical protein n=1 Tax=Rhizobium meliloti TaxID=382 RepID=UPI000FD9C2C2|nr:hypothetical protein [Sinorhizobium meliloti]RVJ99088.1 hypothetical protein CN169_00990 [Sinorhizobium meliloti]